MSLDCTDGDVRVMGGGSEWEGRVEICQNNNFLRVCDDLWDEAEARVVCKQLNYFGPGLCHWTEYMCEDANAYKLMIHNIHLLYL